MYSGVMRPSACLSSSAGAVGGTPVHDAVEAAQHVCVAALTYACRQCACRWLAMRNSMRLAVMFDDVYDLYSFVDPDNDAPSGIGMTE